VTTKIERLRTDPAVAAFLGALDHPLKPEIVAVCDIILGVSPEIGEGVKWNAPSFRTTEYFATVHLRSRETLQLIFHLGAKARPDVKVMEIADPAGLMKWLAKDRCVVALGTGRTFKSNTTAFKALVRDWVKYL